MQVKMFSKSLKPKLNFFMQQVDQPEFELSGGGQCLAASKSWHQDRKNHTKPNWRLPAFS
jgi:hypothetical protein